MERKTDKKSSRKISGKTFGSWLSCRVIIFLFAGKAIESGKMCQHFSRVKGSALVAVQRRRAGCASHEIPVSAYSFSFSRISSRNS